MENKMIVTIVAIIVLIAILILVPYLAFLLIGIGIGYFFREQIGKLIGDKIYETQEKRR